MVSLSSDEFTKVIVFAVFGCAVGALTEFFLKVFKLPIPYTVLVFYMGLALSLIQRGLHIESSPFIQDSTAAADIIVFGLLPALLFSETMHLNWYLVRQAFVQSALLAGPGGIIVASQLAVCAYYFLPFNWSWNYSFLFGAIMSATDPVSVVNLLKTANASSSLSTIIAGESLLNDGSAMILFFMFFNMIEGKTYTVVTFIEFISSMLFLSPLIGFAFGTVSFLFMRKVARPTNLNMDFQILATFACGYGSFYVAQALLDVSGVLACCAAGVTVSFLVNPAIVEHEKMHEVWSVVEWVCNTLIFLLGGFLGGEHFYRNVNVVNVCLLFVIYLFLIITRSSMMMMLFPAVSRIGMKLTSSESIFVVYAGLRGALAIALAAVADGHAKESGRGTLGGQFFFMVSGVVSLTLLINGSTAGALLIRLKLVEDPKAPMSRQKQRVLRKVTRYMKTAVGVEIDEIKSELGDYDADEVARLCKLLHTDNFNFGAAVDPSTAFGVALDLDNLSAVDSVGPLAPSGYGGGDLDGDGDGDGDDGNGNGTRDNGAAAGDAVERGLGLRGGGRADERMSSTSIDTDDTDDETAADVVSFLRSTFLDILRARYMDSVHSGRIGTSSTAAKILLFSVDFAQDSVKDSLADWPCVERSLVANKLVLRTMQTIDNVFAACGMLPGLVSWLDTVNERVAIYVLINFIDAHEFALKKMQLFLGRGARFAGAAFPAGPGSKGGRGGGRGDGGRGRGGRGIGGRRGSLMTHGGHVIETESIAAIEKARLLLAAIPEQDLRRRYTLRAAKTILRKQEEVLQSMIKSGMLSLKVASSLLSAVQEESNQINVVGIVHDREFNRETYTRKKEEEWTLRESLRQSITSAAGPGAGAGVGMGIGSRAVSVDATTGRGVGPHMLQTDDEEQGGTFGNGHGNGHGNDEDYGDGNGGAAGLDRDSESFASTTRASLREMLTGEGVLLPRSSGSAAVPTGVIGRAGAGVSSSASTGAVTLRPSLNMIPPRASATAGATVGRNSARSVESFDGIDSSNVQEKKNDGPHNPMH